MSDSRPPDPAPARQPARQPVRRAVIGGSTAAALGLLVMTAAAGCGGSADRPMRAADGTNVAACADGNCEVAISRPVAITLSGTGDVDTLTVTKVGPDGFDFKTSAKDGGTGSGNLARGDCVSTSWGGGGGLTCGKDLDPAERQDGVLAMQIVGKTDQGALVLRIVSGRPGPPPPSFREPPFLPPPD